MRLELLKMALNTSAAFSVQHACDLSTTHTTAHGQAQCWKGSPSHKTAMPQSVAILRYYRARGVCALQSSSLFCLVCGLLEKKTGS